MTTHHRRGHTPPPRPRRCAASALAAVVLVAAWTATLAAAAHAHADLLASSPAAGDAVPVSTDRLILSFAQPVVPASGRITVVGPDGNDVTAGDVDVQGALVQVPLHLSGAGSHTVAYRVVAADGHVATGGLSFEATTGAGTGSVLASAPDHPAAPEQDGPRPWLWGGAATMLAAALVALHRQRRRHLRSVR